MGAIKKPIGLYIHFPFCLKKCNYCDFVSFPCENHPGLFEKYIEVLNKELELYLEPEKYHFDSVYFGGGTPSLLSVKQLDTVLKQIDKLAYIASDCEISIESNPETITRDKLSEFSSIGINRISLGIQSCNDKELKILGRVYNSRTCINAARLIERSCIHNVNFDIMYGLPYQTYASLRSTLKQMLQFHPTHISAYELTLDNDTCLDRRVKRGTLNIPSTYKILKMQQIILNKLKNHSISRYEVSNYSKQGYQCRHNMHYWNQDEYIGCGIAASGFLNNQRYTNTSVLSTYFEDVILKKKPVACIETLTERQKEIESLMLQLRLVKPLPSSIVKRMINKGLFKFLDKTGSLNIAGFAALNSITTELM